MNNTFKITEEAWKNIPNVNDALEENIVIDFDIKNEAEKKNFEKSLVEASKWPKTHATSNKNGTGVHLDYVYGAFGDIYFQDQPKVIYKISEEVWQNTPWLKKNFTSFILRDDITKEYHHFFYWDFKHKKFKMVTSKQDLDNLIRFEGYFIMECA